MMRIERLLTAPDRAGRYRVQFEDGTIMRLYRQTVEDFGLYTGMELTDDELEKLCEKIEKEEEKKKNAEKQKNKKENADAKES